MTTYSVISPVAWPSEFLTRETSLSWELDPAAAQGPPALDGTFQSRDSIGGPQWRLTLANIQIRHVTQVMAWQVLEGLLLGGKNPVLLPIFLKAQNPAIGATGGVQVRGAWALRAVSGRVTNNTYTLTQGMHFSFTDGSVYGKRMYRILKVTAVGGHADWKDLEWTPPLRFAVADTTTVNVDSPGCVMRLSDPRSMKLDLSQRRFANVSPTFVEA